jgi:hypothetical protein
VDGDAKLEAGGVNGNGVRQRWWGRRW